MDRKLFLRLAGPVGLLLLAIVLLQRAPDPPSPKPAAPTIRRIAPVSHETPGATGYPRLMRLPELTGPPATRIRRLPYLADASPQPDPLADALPLTPPATTQSPTPLPLDGTDEFPVPDEDLGIADQSPAADLSLDAPIPPADEATDMLGGLETADEPVPGWLSDSQDGSTQPDDSWMVQGPATPEGPPAEWPEELQEAASSEDAIGAELPAPEAATIANPFAAAEPAQQRVPPAEHPAERPAPARAPAVKQVAERLAPWPVPDAVARRAATLLEDGFQLAERRAMFTARHEFLRVLTLITQAYDAQSQSSDYSQALERGLRAIDEADDFNAVAGGSAADPARIVSFHQTAVLKNADLQGTSLVVCRQRYYEYAEQQLLSACGESPQASQALYGLGRLQGAIDQAEGIDGDGAATRAMVFYQAALRIDPENVQAANELGVLFGRNGQLRDALAVLQHAARVNPRPEIWRNLASVHQQLGEDRAAELALQEYQRSAAVPEAQAGNPLAARVQWVSPDEFAGRANVTPAETTAELHQSTASSPVAWLRRALGRETPAQEGDSPSLR